MTSGEGIGQSDGIVTVSAIELERLLIAIESSQQVHRRHQFFLWSQGVIQSFLPHDVMLIAHGEYGSPRFRGEVLARGNLFDSLGDHQEMAQLLEQLAERWRHGGCKPLLIPEGSGGAVGTLLEHHKLGHALAHGAPEFLGDSAGFFVFLRMHTAPGRRQAYFAEILMPYLHAALHRMLSAEKSLGEVPPRPLVTLSGREIRVIGLIRDGKTNREIADLLELSPLTVKNHVQNILRKLGVSNRAQAVAKAVKSHLLDQIDH